MSNLKNPAGLTGNWVYNWLRQSYGQETKLGKLQAAGPKYQSELSATNNPYTQAQVLSNLGIGNTNGANTAAASAALIAKNNYILSPYLLKKLNIIV